MNEKSPMIYIKDNIQNNYQVCVAGCTPSGSIRRITCKTFNNLKNTKSKYILIKKDESLTLKETYQKFISDADTLKAATNSEINMYITGSIKDTAKWLFYNLLSKDIEKRAQPIKYKEYKWIQQCTRGATAYFQKYKGPGYLYNFISMYPFLQQSNQNQFPIAAGEFKTISSVPEFFSFGIYYCILHKIGHDYLDALRKFNKYNKYTHIDLNLAKALGYRIEMILDSKPNALLYNTNCLVRGRELFGKYVDKLFALKKAGIDVAKELLNVLWGLLTQNCEVKLYADTEGPELEVFDSRKIINIVPLNDTKSIVNVIKRANCYKTNFGRIKPFVLAYGRKKVETTINMHMDSIKWIYTDGFISSKKLPIKCSNTELGKLCYIGYKENCKVNGLIDKTKAKKFKK